MTPSTNVHGRYLLSYRRVRERDAQLLERELLDVGIQTWRDTRDLPFGNTPSELDAMLDDPNLSGAVLYLTPEVSSSPYVLDVEVPGVFKRAKERAFIVVPVAGGGLDYDGVSALLNGRIGIERLETWRIEIAKDDPLSDRDARRVASRLLQQRLALIKKSGREVNVEVSTRAPIPFSASNTLSLDHSGYFPLGRSTAEGERRILGALQRVRDALGAEMPNSQVRFRGLVGLPYALALGALFSATRSLNAAWLQRRMGCEDELWSLAQPSTDGAVGDHRVSRGTPGSTDVAVVLSVTDDVNAAFGRFSDDVRFGAVVSLDGVHAEHLSRAQASATAYRVVECIREARRMTGGRSALHVFAAAPTGLVFMIGQLLNTFEHAQTYEFSGQRYERSLSVGIGV